MLSFILNLILSALAVYLAARLLPGVTVTGFFVAFIVAIVLGFVNAVIRPILLILTLPINILTLGLFTFVIIGALVLLVAAIIPGFQVDNFLWALVFALVLAIINGIFGLLVK